MYTQGGRIGNRRRWLLPDHGALVRFSDNTATHTGDEMGALNSLRDGYRGRNWEENASVIRFNFVCAHTINAPGSWSDSSR